LIAISEKISALLRVVPSEVQAACQDLIIDLEKPNLDPFALAVLHMSEIFHFSKIYGDLE